MDGTRRFWPRAVAVSLALHGAGLAGLGLFGGRGVVQARPIAPPAQAIVSWLEEEENHAQIYDGLPQEPAHKPASSEPEAIETLPALLLNPVAAGTAVTGASATGQDPAGASAESG